MPNLKRCHGLAPWSFTLAATKKGHGGLWRCHGLVPWSFTLAARNGAKEVSGDATALRRGVSRLLLQTEPKKSLETPRPCAVEFHACCYKRSQRSLWRCHGLAPWSFTLAATNGAKEVSGDATALCRGVSRLLLQTEPKKSLEMPRPCAVEFHACCYKRSQRSLWRRHGLVPWSFTLVATNGAKEVSGDATALRRGVSRLLLQTEPKKS